VQYFSMHKVNETFAHLAAGETRSRILWTRPSINSRLLGLPTSLSLTFLKASGDNLAIPWGSAR